ncbi:unnamed protein product [Meloidogyne enterolobii]|uniref:Uncharacterized protein n=2 Tax=Meloidogyne enterolobii TaxID=390850 RepID=A0ACB0Y236_MELEN
MLFWFDDGSGTRKASTTLRSATTILPMFFASTLFVFVLLGQVNSEGEYNGRIGFFNHTLKDGQVTLNYSSVAVEKGDDHKLAKYTKLSGSCDVEIKGSGNIVLHYRKNGEKNIKGEGCTVDLLTKHSNMIKFRTGVELNDKNGTCLERCSVLHILFDDASANLLPFAYSYSTTKHNITKLENGPLKGNKDDCRHFEMCGEDEQLCMPWTSLEVAWNRCIKDDENPRIFAHTHPSKPNKSFNCFDHLNF